MMPLKFSKMVRLGSGLVALVSATAQAQIVETFTLNANTAIPDDVQNSLQFVSSSMSVASSINAIGHIDLNLSISPLTDGGWLGDFYVLLAHGGNSVVLLNRVGVGDPAIQWPQFGYQGNGLNITLSDSADSTRDIHQYRQAFGSDTTTLTGTWAPDGRTTSPVSATLNDPRTSFLSSFDGMDPNGTWNLSVYDYGTSFTSKLDSWSINITAVPEPQQYALIGSMGLMGFGFYRRFRKKRAIL